MAMRVTRETDMGLGYKVGHYYDILLGQFTNLKDWGYKRHGQIGRRFGNSKYVEYHNQLPLWRLCDFLAGGEDWLHYTGAIAGRCWVSIDVDSHQGQTDHHAHMQTLLDDLGITNPYTFPTGRGLQSIIRFEGSRANRPHMLRLRQIVEQMGRENNRTGRFQSTVELAGYPGIIEHGRVITHGKLARMPRVTTADEIGQLQEINLPTSHLSHLLSTFNVSTQLKNSRKHRSTVAGCVTTSNPSISPNTNRARNLAKNPAIENVSTQLENRKSRTEEKNAYTRMRTACLAYRRRHGLLPATAEALLAFYEAEGFATGDATPERSQRAETVLAWAVANVTFSPVGPSISIDTYLPLTNSLSVNDRRIVLGKRSKRGYSIESEELSLILATMVTQYRTGRDNFGKRTPRDFVVYWFSRNWRNRIAALSAPRW